MTLMLQNAAAISLLSVAVLSPMSPSIADPTKTVGEISVSEGQQIQLSNIVIKTDKYLVPKNVCPDVEAEKFEDCVPWSFVGENILLALPLAE